MEHLRAEAVRAVVGAQHVAELLERLEQAKDRALVEVGPLRQVGQGDLVIRERVEDRERAIHRRHAALAQPSQVLRKLSFQGEG